MTEQQKRDLMRLMADMNEVRMRMVNPYGNSFLWLGLATAVICPIGLMWLIYMLYFGGR
jgi:hypothetical protein